MRVFREAHPFADIAPHCPLQLTEAGLKYLLFPSLSLLSFVGGSSMPLLLTYLGYLVRGLIIDEWSNSANRWDSLDILIVGGWRKEGGKVKLVDKKKSDRN
jgi:hypothetical protein